MMWVDQQQAVLRGLAFAWSRIDHIGGLTNQFRSGGGRSSDIAAPADERRIDLYKAIRRFAGYAAGMTRGTLRLPRVGGTEARLRFVADNLPALWEMDHLLTRMLCKEASVLLGRCVRMAGVDQDEWRPMDHPCTECGERLRFHVGVWCVRCFGCGATWTQELMRAAMTTIPDQPLDNPPKGGVLLEVKGNVPGSDLDGDQK